MDRRLALAGLGLASLALRPQLIGIGPLLPAIEREFDVSHTVAGLLPSIPIICMGLLAPVAPYLARRVGTRIGLFLCIAAIAVFGFARAVSPGIALVIAATLGIGVGMGLAGTLLPIAVKERFAHRPVLATGVYATGLAVGSAIAAATAVPLAHAFGGWRGALVAFSVLTVALGVVWLQLTRGAPAHVRAVQRPPRLPWKSPIAWALVLVFGLESVCYYGFSSWLADAYHERGWSEVSAGALLAVFQFANLPATLVVSLFADRIGSRRLYLGAGSVALLAACLGVVLAPDAGYLWAVVAGAAIGTMFPIALSLPLDLARRPEDVGALAALMLGGGYVIAAAGPLALGAIRDLTGSFTVVFWVLSGLAAVLVVAVQPFSGRRLARGV
jgi:CP family cyanate transporter-like MFS transporter